LEENNTINKFEEIITVLQKQELRINKPVEIIILIPKDNYRG